MKLLKKVFVVGLIVLIPAGIALAQVNKGDKELGVAASWATTKEKGASDSLWGYHLALRLGYFLTQNFEIEPEIIFAKFKDLDAGYILSANLAYHFNPASKNVFFVLGGIGISNTFIILPLPNVLWFGGIEDESWMVFNGGAGIKAFMSKTWALRVEYRFQYFSGDLFDLTNHYLMVGISGFFKKK